VRDELHGDVVGSLDPDAIHAAVETHAHGSTWRGQQAVQLACAAADRELAQYQTTGIDRRIGHAATQRNAPGNRRSQADSARVLGPVEQAHALVAENHAAVLDADAGLRPLKRGLIQLRRRFARGDPQLRGAVGELKRRFADGAEWRGKQRAEVGRRALGFEARGLLLHQLERAVLEVDQDVEVSLCIRRE
jgi:hypothetical protein